MHGGAFARNKAAVISLYVLIAITIFAFFGGFVAAWPLDEIDWSAIGTGAAVNGRPSFATGHYFGVDQEGRDLFARTRAGHTDVAHGGPCGVGRGRGRRYPLGGGRRLCWRPHRPNHDADRRCADVDPLHVRADPASGDFRPVQS